MEIKNFTGYSDQIEKVQSDTDLSYLAKGESGGMLLQKAASVTTAATAVDGTIALAELPAGALVSEIFLAWDALSTGGSTAGGDIGLYTRSGVVYDKDLFAGAEDMDSAGSVTLKPVSTVAGETFLKVPDDQPYVLAITVTGEAFAADKKITAAVQFVKV